MTYFRHYPQEGECDFIKRQAYNLRFINSRLDCENKTLSQKSDHFKPLTVQQYADIERYWKKFIPNANMDLVNMKFYELYNAVCEDETKLKYYIPDSFFYAFIDAYYSNPRRSAAVDDKQLYDFYFADCNRPKTICRKIDDCFFDADFNKISSREFIDICKEHGEVFVKASINSFGGHGVLCWNAETDSEGKLLDFVYKNTFGGWFVFRENKQYVVQEALRQHPAFGRINSSSVNTIRIVTLFFDGEAHPLSSVLRMGVDGSRVDNCSSGGIVVGIDKQGKLKDRAYDNKANVFYKHPQGFDFAGMQVPAYWKCVELAKRLAMRFCGTSRLISWDFAVNEQCEPVIIEMNISYGEIDFHQLCNGPLLGNLTDKVLADVKENNWFLNRIFDEI